MERFCTPGAPRKSPEGVIRRNVCYKKYDRCMALIQPEPEQDERDAIIAALEPPRRQGGQWAGQWAEAALREAVSAEDAGSFTEHDVCSLW